MCWPAAFAAVSSFSQARAGMIVELIEVCVRSFVFKNCRASVAIASCFECRSCRCTSPACASGEATQR